ALIPALYWGNLGIPTAALKATVRSLVLFAVYNLAIGAAVPFIDNAGHLGGLILGLVAGVLLARSLTAEPERKRMIVLGSFALLSVVLVLGARKLQRIAGFAPHLARAQAALDRGDNATAVAELNIVITQQPRLAEAQFMLGGALIQLKQYQQAEAPLRRATELAPRSAAAWTQLCYLHDVLERFDAAYADCQHALEIAPSDPAALDNEASALIGLKRYDEAITMLEKLVKQQPKMTEAWNDLGQAYAESARKKDAIAAYTQALKLDPKNEDATNGLAAAQKAQ
ncbi:MAG TPA: rhomboid family intramembrane serine protease, partial [Terriglobales bacterium]|nr:rhomboid family intramembrane serine protease [Terriglobales bacterium]